MAFHAAGICSGNWGLGSITLTVSYTFNEYRQADRRADSGELFEGSQF